MESFMFIVIGAVLFAQGWNLLRVVDLRTVGLLAAAGAIGLLGMSTIGDIAAASDVSNTIIVTYAILLALYAAVLAAVGLWDFDARTLGLYAIFLGVGAIVFALVFLGILEDANADASDFEVVAGLASLVLGVVFILLFVTLVPPLRRTYQTVTGYAVLIGGAAVAVLGLLEPLEVV